jgi:hypothetical protein
MSKRNRNRQVSSISSTLPVAGEDLVEEYRIIRHDLLRVLIVNVIFLAGVLALYYSNLNSRYLDRWFEKLF